MYCNQCQLRFSDQEGALSHYSSDEHQNNNGNEVEISAEDTDPSLDSDASSDEEVGQSRDSQGHSLNLGEQDRYCSNTVEASNGTRCNQGNDLVSDRMTSPDYPGKINIVNLGNNLNRSDKKLDMKIAPSVAEQTGQGTSTGEVKSINTPGARVSPLGDRNCNSEMSAEQHLAGETHRKKVAGTPRAAAPLGRLSSPSATQRSSVPAERSNRSATDLQAGATVIDTDLVQVLTNTLRNLKLSKHDAGGEDQSVEQQRPALAKELSNFLALLRSPSQPANSPAAAVTAPLSGTPAGAVDSHSGLNLPKGIVRTPPTRDGHTYFCQPCRKPLNAADQVNFHVAGKGHRQKLSTMPAETRKHATPPVKFSNVLNDVTVLVTNPRSYQLELFRKAMNSDILCFLPTGTGKTLIAIMLICKMLKLNPGRQVVFLVDKVLLVLQQSAYIQIELGDMMIGGSPIKIATLYGQKVNSCGDPLNEQHVIVSTAAFYENCLEHGSLRYEDVALIVFDEAHHCVKGHPFNRILRTNHLTLEDLHRPRLLGLTASPAGGATLNVTMIMLKKLLSNMGDAKVVRVDQNRDELALFAANVKLEFRVTTMRPVEEEFSRIVLNHLLAECLPTLKSDFPTIIEKMEQALALQLMSAMAEVAREVDHLERGGGLAAEFKVELNHVRVCVESLHTLMVCGVTEASKILVETLIPVIDGSDGLSCRFRREAVIPDLRPLFQRLCESGDDRPSDGYEIVIGLVCSAVVTGDAIVPHILVLAQHRNTVKTLYDKLNSDERIPRLGLQATWLSGHGTTSCRNVKGMTVAKQRQHLERIQDGTDRLIVATDVAGEGIDIPQCSLVIVLYPPTTITTLVQFRGRARKLNGKFVALVDNERAKVNLESLMSQEQKMIDAVNIVYAKQIQASQCAQGEKQRMYPN